MGRVPGTLIIVTTDYCAIISRHVYAHISGIVTPGLNGHTQARPKLRAIPAEVGVVVHMTIFQNRRLQIHPNKVYDKTTPLTGTPVNHSRHRADMLLVIPSLPYFHAWGERWEDADPQ